MRIQVMTLFPEMVQEIFNTSILKRAVERELLQVNTVNIRDYSAEKHKKVDDYPYGGGAGMLMQAQPIYDAYQHITGGSTKKVRTIYVTPQGQQFHQGMAQELAKEEELIFLCGHYEGIDERVLSEIVTDYVSIGDYVLTGGELPAMVMIDAIARLIPEVLHNDISAQTESFQCNLLEYPQYTRPELWRGKAVPEVLLSGDHKKIHQWRLEESIKRTKERRPDLYGKYRTVDSLLGKLNKKKRKYIHISESLRCGRGELLYLDEKSNSFAVLEMEAEELYLEGAELNCCDEALWKQISHIYTTQQSIPERVAVQGKGWKAESLKQAVYTKNETLPLRHKDIRRIAWEQISKENLSLEGIDREGMDCQTFGYLLGAYREEKLVGFLLGKYPGRIDYVWVKEEERKKKVASSLEAFAINEALGLLRTAYVRIPSKCEEGILLQESLGLFLYEEEIFHIFR